MDSYKITFNTFNKAAAAYQEKFMDLDLYNDTYDHFCSYLLNANASILEIGCGPGNITSYILSKKPLARVEGIDMAPAMIALAQKNNPTASFKVMDARRIDKLQTKYDGIIAGFCLPYLSMEDCGKFVEDCAALLEVNGVLYCSTIEGRYEDSGFETSGNGIDRAFVYYYQSDYLEKVLARNNFELLHLIRKEYSRANGIPSTHIIFIARKRN